MKNEEKIARDYKHWHHSLRKPNPKNGDSKTAILFKTVGINKYKWFLIIPFFKYCH